MNCGQTAAASTLQGCCFSDCGACCGTSAGREDIKPGREGRCPLETITMYLATRSAFNVSSAASTCGGEGTMKCLR